MVAGNEVGEFATVGAGAVVTRPVVAHALVVGSPAHRIGWVCACGTRLLGANGEPARADLPVDLDAESLHCPSCGRTYAHRPGGGLNERSAAVTA